MLLFEFKAYISMVVPHVNTPGPHKSPIVLSKSPPLAFGSPLASSGEPTGKLLDFFEPCDIGGAISSARDDVFFLLDILNEELKNPRIFKITR